MSTDLLDDLLVESRRLAGIAVAAAELVREDLRAAFRSAGMRTDFKRDEHDPVTEHDRHAEERIREFLLAQAPGSTVVGEEAGRSSGVGRISWYVDPIDGTANFARGMTFWCTSVGATVDGRIVAGAVLDPVAGRMFQADLGGAYLDGAPIRSQGPVAEARSLLICSYPNARAVREDGAEGLARFGHLVDRYGTVRKPGSAALSLCHVAAGWADAALGTSVNAWDVCAARLIVEQAGGSYHAFGGPSGSWDQPGYAAHTANLDPVALRAFVRGHQTGRPGDGAW